MKKRGRKRISRESFSFRLPADLREKLERRVNDTSAASIAANIREILSNQLAKSDADNK